jgi:hypothetical protein
MCIILPKAARLSAAWMAGRGLFEKSTPRFAKIVSHKFCAPRRGTSYGRRGTRLWRLGAKPWSPPLEASLQDLATHVGTVVQTKEESWSYATPALGRVATIGIGIDGTCMLTCDQKWRVAMTSAISVYDRHGERLHTIYVGAAPEYGKAAFFNRIEHEIDHVKSLYPTRQGRRRWATECIPGLSLATWLR